MLSSLHSWRTARRDGRAPSCAYATQPRSPKQSLEAAAARYATRMGHQTRSIAALVHAGDRLYVTNMSGETVVLAASPKREVLARNRLNDRVLASLAIADGEIRSCGLRN